MIPWDSAIFDANDPMRLYKWRKSVLFRYKDHLIRWSHCKDKTLIRPSYLYYGNTYTGKISFHWNGPSCEAIIWTNSNQIKSSSLSYWYKVKYKIKADSHVAICLVPKSVWHNTKYKDKITNLAQIAVIQYRDIWTIDGISIFYIKVLRNLLNETTWPLYIFTE